MSAAPDDPRDVTLAVLANLIRLMGAELVAGRHRDDIDRFEAAVRFKLVDVTVTGHSPAAAEAGLAQARSLVETVLTCIRAQHAATLTRSDRGPSVARSKSVH